ncbi:hypothetical protein, partial [Roseobacter sp.]|uniref:hypothetical protein n=1 Tax=Roseobacter sp. TaxID=1907202 RepID=UPI0025F84B85
MMRALALICGLLAGIIAAPVAAQDPQITVTAEQEEVMVGQPFMVVVQVLVPTFMPKAPVFPGFEMPGLIVRLPERSTAPVSEKIDGVTWAGVRRTYRIYPMREGVTEIPAQEISIVYKDTATNEDVALTAEVPATRIVATVPPGARTLDPLVLAQEITVTQSWDAAEGELAVGDAIVRALEISVTGASALFVPPLLDAAPPRPAGTTGETEVTGEPGATFGAYPEDARVTETINRGVMSGTRSEEITYIAQTGGDAEFPDITLRWFNTGSNEVEEIVLPGRRATVTRPAPVRAPLNRDVARRGALFLLVTALVLLAGRRWLVPVLARVVNRIRDTYAASAWAAHLGARRSARHEDLNGLLDALEARRHRGAAPGATLTGAVDALGRARWRDGAGEAELTRHWAAVRSALRRDRPVLTTGQH